MSAHHKVAAPGLRLAAGAMRSLLLMVMQLLLATSVAVMPGAAAATTPGEVPVGAPLREARLDGLNGPARKLSELRGQPLLINVWASWCGPCRAEMASLERLAWLEAKPPYPTAFRIIGISTDDYRDKALALLKGTNATISHYIDHQLELEHMLGADKIPLTVLVDARGQVVEKVYGAREWDSAESRGLIEKAFTRARAGKGVR
jgi:thiol-disulfide isomerase/thioredoxin